jgi:hypothetical protein
VGFVTAQRLAHMLDSLVRVSRRVGKWTDRFATDAEYAAQTPARWPAAVRGHWRQSPQIERPTTNEAERRPRSSRPRSASGPTPTGSITPTPRCRSPSPDASDRRRTGRGAPLAESAPAAAGATPRSCHEACSRERRPTADELNPTSGLCGTIRLPLDGFTYC